MKFLFLLWITIRGTFDASVWATAVWCLLYSFTNVLWLQCFGIFLAIHFIWNLSFLKYISTHTRQDCFSYLRLELVLFGLSILYAPIISILPTVGAIVLLSFLQTWTNLETHWLHTFLFVTCVVYNLLRGREKRRMALHANSNLVQRHRTDPGAGIVAKDGVELLHCEEWVDSQEPPGKVARSARKAAKGRRSVRVIDV
jgi:hypothetical protein